jgi:hypothetical protein
MEHLLRKKIDTEVHYICIFEILLHISNFTLDFDLVFF